LSIITIKAFLGSCINGVRPSLKRRILSLVVSLWSLVRKTNKNPVNLRLFLGFRIWGIGFSKKQKLFVLFACPVRKNDCIGV